MSDDRIIIFESTETKVVRHLERALTKAKIAYESKFDRPTLGEHGIKKKPIFVYVERASETLAKACVEVAAAQRERIDSLQPKSARTGSGFGDDGGSFNISGDFGGFDGGGDGGSHH